METIRLQINGKETVVEKGSTIMEAARQAGVDIPSLCYDPRLKPFAACRLCFVEVEGSPKPVTACTAEAAEGMAVRTKTDALHEIRKSALELLLSDHYGDCVAPCQTACPAGIDTQGFVAHIANGQYGEAAALIREKLPFPSSVGRVCPRFCEDACRRTIVDEPVAICMLKRFAGDAGGNPPREDYPAAPETGKKAAVVGGGPAGLTAAHFLRRRGHSVTIFEAEEKLGGMLRYGIPEYRLPKEVLDAEIEEIVAEGVDVECGSVLGRDFTVEGLKEQGYDAVFVGIGCQSEQQAGLEGEGVAGVYSGLEFLKDNARGAPVSPGSKVVVVGGGNTAMDAARTALRLGAKEVTVVYRRSEKEMPADPREVAEAKEEGVKFLLLSNPKRLLADSRLRAVECLRMQLGEPDAGGRRRPVPIEGSEFTTEADSLILAIGQAVDPISLEGSGISVDARGRIEVAGETFTTSLEGVFAGGDCISGPATVVEAVGHGRKAAAVVDRFLRGETPAADTKDYNCTKGELEELDPAEFEDVERIARVQAAKLSIAETRDNFREIELGFTSEQAQEEALRCMSCGCQEIFDCRLRELATEHGVEEKSLAKIGYHHPVIEDHDYIERDPNKCILCGSCVRICQEVQGVGALGFVNRGLNTVVKPELELPLAETACESCGQCVSACPTGALKARVPLPKPGPWEVRSIPSVCVDCSVGCGLEIDAAGARLVGVREQQNGKGEKENLCVRGRFEYSVYGRDAQQNLPMVKMGKAVRESTWEDALDTAASGLKSALARYGEGSTAVVVSPRVSNETAYAAQAFARQVLGTANVAPMEDYFAPDGPGENGTAPFSAIDESDCVLVLNADLQADYPVLGVRVRKAALSGAQVLVVGGRSTSLDRPAAGVLRFGHRQSEKLLEALAVYANHSGTAEALAGELEPLLRDLPVKPEKVLKVLRAFLTAARPVIVFDGGGMPQAESELLQKIAGETRCGVVPLYPAGNALGIRTAGVDPGFLPGGRPAQESGMDNGEIITGIGSGSIKALVAVAAEDDIPPGFLGSPGVFTVVIAAKRQTVLEDADVVLPAAAYPETGGSYTNSEGRTRWSEKAFSPAAGKETWETISELAGRMQPGWGFDSFESIADGLQAELGGNLRAGANPRF